MTAQRLREVDGEGEKEKELDEDSKIKQVRVDMKESQEKLQS